MSEKEDAEKLGRIYGKYIIELDGDVKKMAQVQGSGFWKNFKKGMKKGMKSEFGRTIKSGLKSGYNMAKSGVKTGVNMRLKSTPVLTHAKYIKDKIYPKSNKDGDEKKQGSGLWKNLKKGMKKTLHYGKIPLELGAMAVGQPEIAGGVEALDQLAQASGKRPKRKGRKISDKMKRRNVLVKKLMKEHGLSLVQASKKIKAENIDY